MNSLKQLKQWIKHELNSSETRSKIVSSRLMDQDSFHNVVGLNRISYDFSLKFLSTKRAGARKKNCKPPKKCGDFFISGNQTKES